MVSASSALALEPEEESDGSFLFDVSTPYLESELIYSKGAFRNIAVVFDVEVCSSSTGDQCECDAFGGDQERGCVWYGGSNCSSSIGGIDVGQCMFDTGRCIQACYTDHGLPPPAPTEEINCDCLYNETTLLGANIPENLNIKTKLYVEDRDTGVLTILSSNPAENPDNIDHVRTVKVAPGLWRLEWEDKVFNPDNDFNDVVILIKARRPLNQDILETVGICGPDTERRNVITDHQYGYVQNFSVDPISIPENERRIRLTTVFFNYEFEPFDIAVCTMLNFFGRWDNEIARLIPRASVDRLGLAYHSANGLPQCNGIETPPLNDDVGLLTDHYKPSVRFSNTLLPHPDCGENGFNSVTPFSFSENYPRGDIMTIPAGDFMGAGSIGVFHDILIKDIDEKIINEEDKLGNLSSDEIMIGLERQLDKSEVIYNDIFFDFQVDKFLCGSGVNTVFLLGQPCDVSGAAVTWHGINEVKINSPATIALPLYSMFTLGWPRSRQVMLTVSWDDNLEEHLKGHITTDPPIRTPFRVGGPYYSYQMGQLTANFPDDLPQGFHGRAYIWLTDVETGGSVVLTTAYFAKDQNPPIVHDAFTIRQADHSVRVAAQAEDQVPALGDLLLQPSVDGQAKIPALMLWTSGNFSDPTSFEGQVGPFLATEAVDLSLRVRDEFRNTRELKLPVAHAGSDQILECTSQQGTQVNLDASLSTGEGPLAIQWAGPFDCLGGSNPQVLLSSGHHEIGLAVLDQQGFFGTDKVSIFVQDTSAPDLEISLTNSHCVWAPNHKYVRFELGQDILVNATDTCDPHPTVRIVRVESSEPDNGLGDGNTTEDIIFGPQGLCIRAERSGWGQGRHYTVYVEASDATGNTTESTLSIFVPHDQRDESCSTLSTSTWVNDVQQFCYFEDVQPQSETQSGSTTLFEPLNCNFVYPNTSSNLEEIQPTHEISINDVPQDAGMCSIGKTRSQKKIEWVWLGILCVFGGALQRRLERRR